jgi:DNA-binding NarL/FixJ family response regulator
MTRTGRARKRVPQTGGQSGASLAKLERSHPRGLAVDLVDDGEFAILSWPVEPLQLDSLSEAERGVLAHVLRGASNAEIATARGSKVRTVANQVTAIRRKLGVGSRFDLIRRFGDGS